jgi:hypothetical protein
MKNTELQDDQNNLEYITWENILKDYKKINFILSKEQIEKILARIGDSIDKESYIINNSTKERELAIDSAEIKSNEIGAILPGSKVFIKKNIAGFSDYLAKYCD